MPSHRYASVFARLRHPAWRATRRSPRRARRRSAIRRGSRCAGFERRHLAANRIRGGQRAITGVAMGDADKLAEVRALVEAGVLRAVVAERFPLKEIGSAHASLEGPRPRGSVIVEMAEVMSARQGTSLLLREVA